MIKIIDNVVASRYQTELEATFFSLNFRWAVNTNISGDRKTSQIGFAHDLVSEYSRKSDYVDFIMPLMYEISDAAEINFQQVLQSRIFMQPPSSHSDTNDTFHIDHQRSHIVFLYYVNDSDGDTIITNKKYDFGMPDFIDRDFYHSEKDVIIERVTPKKGRVVVFDGRNYHAAGIPKNNFRCVINTNVVVD